MAQAAAIAAGVGQAYKAYKTRKYHQAQAAEYVEAKNRRMAAATREMAEERRKQEFIHSRAVALAAASGAGVDAGMVKILSDLQAEGEYRVMSLLWQGVNDAQGLLARARAEEKAADDAMVAGAINTVTSAFSAYSASGGTFGGGGSTPPPTSVSTSGLPHTPIPGGAPQLWKGPYS